MINRREALGAMVGAGAASAQRNQRPNLVFVLIDDLRWNALGSTGHPFAQTPNIDRLAKEGVKFQNAFVTTPLCSPSRGSYLTGQTKWAVHGALLLLVGIGLLITANRRRV